MSTHVLWVIVHCLAVVVFVNRYVAGIILRVTRASTWDETREDYEPTITAVIPMFNEGEAIKETLRSLLDSNYPHAKLQVVCVDDCSTDDSYDIARELARSSGGRLRVIRNLVNLGKRRSINRAVRESTAEVIVSVDSDVVVDANAIHQLVRRFTDPRIKAVGGWVDVRNKHDNWLTKMQVVKYWYGYFFLKNLEWGFKRVMCLSGCLTAYQRSVLVELEPVLERREILGVPIKYGEDRYLTRMIVKAGYLTTMTLEAKCRTFVPTTLPAYFSQQLRWRRSNIVDYAGAFSHVWRMNPVLAIHFFSQFALLMVYPIAVIRALMTHRFFPALELHLEAMVLLNLLYCWRVRKAPASERVGPLAFLPLSLLMPVTYALLTPLALFSLDSGSWETRSHHAATEGEAAQPQHDIGLATARAESRSEANVGVVHEPALARNHSRSHAQLPAA